MHTLRGQSSYKLSSARSAFWMYIERVVDSSRPTSVCGRSHSGGGDAALASMPNGIASCHPPVG